MGPFTPTALTPEQQKQIADRALASAKLIEIDSDIHDQQSQLQLLLNLWIGFSALPAQSPNDPNIPNREAIAVRYWATHDLINKLVDYRGAVLGWKLNAGQPGHPVDMPVYTP